MIINDLNDVSNKNKGGGDVNIENKEKGGLLRDEKEKERFSRSIVCEWKSYQKDSKDAKAKIEATLTQIEQRMKF